MPKRKHSDLEPSTGRKPGAEPTSSKQTRLARHLTAKFDNDTESLTKALKVARGFEKQKLGRRGKKARSEEAEKTARLEEEGKILKGLDMSSAATKYVFKQLCKTKRIAETPAFIQFRESRKIPVDGPSNPAEANVLARLYKSTPVMKAMPRIMRGFRALLGLEDFLVAGNTKEGGSEQVEGKEEKRAKVSKTTEDVVDAHDGEKEDVDVDAQRDDNDDHENGFAQFGFRLAASSVEDEDDYNSHPSNNNNNNANAHDPKDPMSITPSTSTSPSASRSPTPEPQRTKKPKQTPTAPPTSTTFLPSLAMGGYISGSESEASDPEDQAVNGRRKNRMGQQARRALWEKKYGTRANHVQKQIRSEKGNRDAGWDVRRGATGGDADGYRGKRGNNRGGAGGGRGRESWPQTQQKKPQDDKPLHPSWEAARKAKESQKRDMSFTGKKVTFD